jgi:hypothetical protein
MVMSNVSFRLDSVGYSPFSRMCLGEALAEGRGSGGQDDSRRQRPVPAPTPEAEIEAMEDPERWDGLA